MSSLPRSPASSARPSTLSENRALVNTDQFIDGYVEHALHLRTTEHGEQEDPGAPLIAGILRDRLNEMSPYLDCALAGGVTVDQFVDGYIEHQEQGRVKGPAGSRQDALATTILADLTRRQLDHAHPYLEGVFGA